ncbi:DEKNAAC100748 [Brettanomyces naardenensis]|uniref:DEKNAAC100748 n=1 Tax=Brettanomyces naardenensis TaxID=13370 RepID=A0A448YER8_BRENA|nr:DEKNAAC100748 [Brettanomyces naardenensis]
MDASGSGDTLVVEVSQLLDNFAQNEPIFDNELLYPSPKESEITKLKDGRLMQATIESIVTYLTSPEIIDYQFMVDFFLSFRKFIDSLPLLELLLCRLTWCLKRSLSPDEAIATTGKLALVRTFVTLRHWLLNHFQDDFLNDKQMRELFTSTINEIPQHNYFVNGGDDLQAKVLVNLKKSYIVMCHIFWNTVSLDKLAETDILQYTIQSYDTIPRSRISIIGLKQLRDPTARRSGILSMVEQTSSSSLNMLLKERADMLRDATNLENILERRSDLRHSRDHPDSRLGRLFAKERFILHPKASLASLGPNNLQNMSRDGTLDNIYTNMLQHVKSTPVQGVKPLVSRFSTDTEDKENNAEINNGFTIHGQVQIFKDSGVTNIAPSTPLKKLKGHVEVLHRTESNDANATAHRVTAVTSTATKSAGESMRSKRRTRFIQHLFQSKEEQTKTSLRPQSVKKPAIKLQESRSALLERAIDTKGKMDVLSTRVIEDYNSLKNSQLQEAETEVKEIPQEPAEGISDIQENCSPVSPLKANGQHAEASINSNELLEHFNDKYAEQVDNIDDSEIAKESDSSAVLQEIAARNATDAEPPSFGSPSVTMNWSHSLDISQTTRDIVDMSLEQTDEHNGDNDSVVSAKELTIAANPTSSPLREIQLKKIETFESGDESKDQVKILGQETEPESKPEPQPSVAPAIPSPLKSNTCPSPILDEDAPLECSSLIEPANLSTGADATEDLDLDKRISVKVISRNSAVSAKSYMTYDSSLSSGVCADEEEQSSNAIRLRKKNALINLRGGADISEDDPSPAIELSASVDTVVVGLFRELPFCEHSTSEHSSQPVLTSSGSTMSMLPSLPQSCLLPYPGISSTAIAELAAIPDKKLSCDPIEYARSKLRGDAHSDGASATAEKKVPGGEGNGDRRSHRTIYMSDLEGAQDKKNESNGTVDEIKLERKVRDLFIMHNPNNDEESSDDVSEAEEDEKPSSDISEEPEHGTSVRLSRKDRAKYSSTLIKHEPERSSSFDMRSLSLTPKRFMYDTQLLSVQEAMYKGNHIPFVLSYESDAMFQQFTLIERDLLLEIDWKELVDMRWDKPLEPYSSWLRLLLDDSDKTALQMVTLRFNLVTNWIISEIVLCKELNVRILTISRFIHLASMCKRRQNYATMFQITLALTSPIVKKLRTTWSHLDAGELLILKELKDVTSPNNDFKAIRDEMDNVVPSKGIIPFMALDVSDLNVNSERPNIVESAAPEKEGEGKDGKENRVGEEANSNAADNSGNEPYELVNFDKFRTRCTIFKRILRMIDWSKFYQLKRKDEVLSKCLYISSLSEEEMNYCLEHLTDA